MRHYDDVPYRGAAYSLSHPWRLGALAHLHGLTAPDPATARCLELGCGDGTNLLSIAATLPGSRCVGVDTSGPAIEAGVQAAAEAEIENCSLRTANLLEVDPGELGSADYVIAHGILSWVPADVRARVFELAGELLAPGGLLLASYNALPGWNLLRASREIARGAIAQSGVDRSAEASAEVAIAALREAFELHGADDAYAAALRLAIGRYESVDAAVLFHDDLADQLEPLALAEVAQAAREAGLDYLGEAPPDHWWPSRMPDRSAKRIRDAAPTPLGRQMRADVASGATFKATVFCKDSEPASSEADPIRCLDLHARAHPDAGAPADGVAPELKATWEALSELGVAGALGRAVAERAGLEEDVAGVALLRLAAELRIDLTLGAPRYVIEPGIRPTTSPLIRILAARGDIVPALTHETIKLGDAGSRAFIQLLDGSRDRPALARDLAASGTVAADAAEIDPVLDEQLWPLAERGLFIA